jgi:mevalonate kinase
MNVSVPGRICLVGEHCDWAGGASVVVPLDRFVRVRVAPAPRLSATALLEGRHLEWTDGEGDPGPLRFVPAVADVLGALGVPRSGAVHIEGELPAGRGFSSSAAVCVALVRALAEGHALTLSPTEVAELAFRAEHDGCGVNCGRLDPLACAHAMPLFLTFLGDEAHAEPLPAHLSLAVGAFRAPRDTVAILAALGRYFRGEVPLRDYDAVRRVGAVRGAIEGFGKQARHARDALLAGDLRALGGSMDTCQEIYEEDLMAALPELRAPGLVRAVRALRAAGALGAKFSGAGGDGSVIGLFPPGDARVGGAVAALDAMGLEAFATDLWSAA